jgi:E3 ubiquitin-protein ligase HUWE1
MDREERVKLIQFVTGTGKIPVGGFSKLMGMSGPQKFNIQRDRSGAHRLPQAHTW